MWPNAQRKLLAWSMWFQAKQSQSHRVSAGFLTILKLRHTICYINLYFLILGSASILLVNKSDIPDVISLWLDRNQNQKACLGLQKIFVRQWYPMLLSQVLTSPKGIKG